MHCHPKMYNLLGAPIDKFMILFSHIEGGDTEEEA